MFDSLLVTGVFNMRNISWTEGNGFVSSIESFLGMFLETLYDCFLIKRVEETTFRKRLDFHVGSFPYLIIKYTNQTALGNLSRCYSILNWKFAIGRMSNEVFRPRRRWLNRNNTEENRLGLIIWWKRCSLWLLNFIYL